MTQPPQGGWQPQQPFGQQPQQPYGQPQQPFGQQPSGPQQGSPFGPGGPGQQPPMPPGGPGAGMAKAGSKFPLGAKIGAGALALVVAGGTAVAIADPLGWRTANVETAKAIPADTVAMASMNLAPGASQQIEMLRFALKFPGVRDRGTFSETTDLKKSLFDSFVKESRCTGADYAADIKPWLGDQAAVALRRGQDEPIAVLAASNEQQAKAGMAKLQCPGAKPGVAFNAGHLVLGRTQAAADAAVAATKSGNLADQKAFSEAMGKVGATGVASYWLSADGLKTLSKEARQPLPTTEFTASAGTLRFSGGNPELVTMTKGAPIKLSGKTAVGDLPGDTAMALGVAGGKVLVPQVMELLSQAGMSPADLRAQTGLDLPTDLETLLGEDFVLAAKTFDPSRVDPSRPDSVPVGLLLKTDRAKLDALLGKFENSGLTLNKVGSDPTAVSLSSAYAQQLSKPTSKLKDNAGYKAAVADADQASAVLYLDINAFKATLKKSMSAKDARNIDPLQALGVSTRDGGDGYSQQTIRLTAS